MALEMIKSGLRNPVKASQYARRRLRDFQADEWITSDYQTVTMSTSFPAFSHELYRDVDLLERALDGYHARQSLEIGVGYGRMTPWIARHADEHFAVDPDERLLADAARLHPEVTYHQVLAQDLPHGDDAFDLVVSWAVLSQVPDRLFDAVCRELERVLAADGRLVVGEKIGDMDATSRVFPRTIEEYAAAFSDRDLVETYASSLPQPYWTEDYSFEALVFE